MALFAALIVPYYMNWDSYLSSFEARASTILGHNVRVKGSAHATILPTPSLTFTDVEVDDENNNPIMTVDRFSVEIELMPLMQGEIHVVSMKLEKPAVHVAVDEAGRMAWLKRAEGPEPIDPEKVFLESVSITDGTLTYDDARSGVSLKYGGISAEVSARSLAGPWHVDGFYLDEGAQVAFRASTGRLLDDGTLRVKADFNPARYPVTVGMDGPVGIDPANGLTWKGTYVLDEVVGEDATGGWKSEGTFALDSGRLAIDKATLTRGPEERSFGLAGSLMIDFGKQPNFSASAESRQIDLDRTLGKGPSSPVDVSAAADNLVVALSHVPVPGIPGKVALNVPAIVVGGRVIEGVTLAAEPAAGGWHISALSARLPGQATLEASGSLTTEQKFGFVGDARLAVAQPATFASWWRGGEQEGAGRLLAPFDLAGHADIAPGRIAVDRVTAKIGDATITGRFAWSDAAKGRPRALGTDLKADRLDFTQVKALAELLAGQNLASTSVLADSYTIIVAADSFVFEDLTVRDVTVNASYADDVLKVVQIGIGDLGGAGLKVTSGEIRSLTTDPQGYLEAQFSASAIGGAQRIVDRFAPDSTAARWLRAAGPALTPAEVKVRVQAPPTAGASGMRITVDNGVARSTVFNIALETGAKLVDWRNVPVKASLELNSPDTVELARQLGLSAVPLDNDTGAHAELHGTGTAAGGIDTAFVADFAGLSANASGSTTISDAFSPTFTGKLSLKSENIDPIIAMAGLGVPGAAIGTKVNIAGSLALSPLAISFDWPSGPIGSTVTAGKVTLASNNGPSWKLDGNLAIDDVDLGWVGSLGLGFAPLPTGDPAQPWSRSPFVAPVYGPVIGKLAVTADHMEVGGLTLYGAKFDLALQPQRMDLNLGAGQIAGGAVAGGLSIHNVGGNANLSGHFDLKGAALDTFVWQRDARSVATGTMDISTNFEATGRSPAGLVSTMTGGGVLALHNGEARYVNPSAVRQLVRASDLGQEYTEDALKLSFAERIDADDLAFGEANGPFAIVAGAVRIKNLAVKAGDVSAVGNAVVDLNTMSLNSDWSLTFAPVDDKVQGIEPKAGIVFRGPIAAPTRTVDVLPFAAYLNEREAARMNEIIALDLATRAEKERLVRFTRRIQSDDASRAEQARIAAEREAARRAAAVASAAVLDAFHANREIGISQGAVATLTAFADRMEQARLAAVEEAVNATKRAKTARGTADAAAKVFADARAAEDAALAAAKSAGDAETAAKADADAAETDRATRAKDADAAAATAANATAAEVEAKANADAAVRAKGEAEAALRVAASNAATTAGLATKADAAATDAAGAKDRADKAEAAATTARDAAQVALNDAQAALSAAEEQTSSAETVDLSSGSEVSRAQAAKDKADSDFTAAVAVAATASADRDSAKAAFDLAAKASSDAAAASDAATKRAAAYEQLAKDAESEAAAAPDDPDAATNAAKARAAAEGFNTTAVSKQAAAKNAVAAATFAKQALDQAESALAEASARKEKTAAAASTANDSLQAALAKAAKAAEARDLAHRGLTERVAARDAAQKALGDRQAVLDKVGADAAAAGALALDATKAAADAQSAANAALAAKATAEKKAADFAAAVADASAALRAATANRTGADAAAKAAAESLTASTVAASAAAKTLGAKSAASDAADAAAASATTKRMAAEQAANAAAAQADAAEQEAANAAATASAAAAAAAAARQTADRAASEAGPMETIEVLAPQIAPAQGAAAGPIDAAGIDAPVATAAPAPAASPAPAPRPRRVLPRVAPDGPQPLTILPR